MGHQQGQGVGGHVGFLCDAFCHAMMKGQGAGAQVQLHNGHGCLPGSMQVKRSRFQAGTKAVSNLGPGGIAELGYSCWRRNVPFGNASHSSADLVGRKRCVKVNIDLLTGEKQKRPGGMSQGGDNDESDKGEQPAAHTT